MLSVITLVAFSRLYLRIYYSEDVIEGILKV